MLSISCYKWTCKCGIRTLTYFIRENLCLNILHPLFKDVHVKQCVAEYSLLLSAIHCILATGSKFEVN